MQISFVAEPDEFLKSYLPQTVLLNATTIEDGITRLVTLYKRPVTFQEAPIYAFHTGSGQQFVPAASSENQDFTWYTTRFMTNPQMAVCIVRVRTENGSVQIRLKDNGLVVLNETAYSLNSSPSLALHSSASSAGNITNSRYHLVSRNSKLPVQVAAHKSDWKLSSVCKHQYIDVCVHVDFDFYMVRKKSMRQVTQDVKDIMNEVQILYERLPTGDDFPYVFHVELSRIHVETSVFSDPIGVRSATLTQAVFNGRVYQSIMSAHNLLTAWLKKNKQVDCDHYIFLTATQSAEFIPQGKRVSVFLSQRTGVAWEDGLCDYETGTFCSVVQDVGPQTFVSAAHELGHNIGLGHDQTNGMCGNGTNYIMDWMLGTDINISNAKWSLCSIETFKIVLKRLLRFYPHCSTVSQADLSKWCRRQYGTDSVYAGPKETGRTASSICKQFLCKNSKTGQVKVMNTPAGTPCGPDKKCAPGGTCEDFKEQCSP